MNIILHDISNPAVDAICLFPVAQQIIGISCSLFSLAYIVGNVAQKIYKQCYAFNNFLNEKEKNQFVKMNNEKREKYIHDLGLNVLRSTPLVGSLVSAFRFATWLGFKLAHQ